MKALLNTWLCAALGKPAPEHEKEHQRLKDFANDIIDAVYDGSDIDGGDVQAIAMKHELLKRVIPVKACAPGCQCDQYYDKEDFDDELVECYRKTF